jgi:hypothetical protein
LPLRWPVNILHCNTFVIPKGPAHDADCAIPSAQPEDCLVAVMIAVSASTKTIRTAELVKIEPREQPAGFRRHTISIGWGHGRRSVFDLFEQGGRAGCAVRPCPRNLPERLNETAYALACDVAAADGTLAETELRLLEEIRYELNIDRLHAAAIERGARARHLTL